MGSSQKAEIEMVAIKIELGEGFEERFSGLSRTRSSHCLNALKARKVSSSSRAGVFSIDALVFFIWGQSVSIPAPGVL